MKRSPQVVIAKRTGNGLPLAERVAYYSHPEPLTGCTLWSGPVSGYGYPMLMVGRKALTVSRYVLGVSRPSDVACHRCDNPLCVNRRHLYVGTHKTNAQDRDTRGRNAFSSRTACKHGHVFDEANTKYYTIRGKTRRACRACNRRAAAALKARKVAAARTAIALAKGGQP